jgi:hypothetical protein
MAFVPFCRMGLPFGASPPMRMTASWSPTRTGRPNTRLLRTLYAPPRQASSPLIKSAVCRTECRRRCQTGIEDDGRWRDRRSSSSRLTPAAPLRSAPSGDDAHRSRRVGRRADQDGLRPPVRRASHPPREPPDGLRSERVTNHLTNEAPYKGGQSRHRRRAHAAPSGVASTHGHGACAPLPTLLVSRAARA